MIDSKNPDWTREHLHPGEWNPGKRLLSCIRDYQRYRQKPAPLGRLCRMWAIVRHRFYARSAAAEAVAQQNSALSDRGALYSKPVDYYIFSLGRILI